MTKYDTSKPQQFTVPMLTGFYVKDNDHGIVSPWTKNRSTMSFLDITAVKRKYAARLGVRSVRLFSLSPPSPRTATYSHSYHVYALSVCHDFVHALHRKEHTNVLTKTIRRESYRDCGIHVSLLFKNCPNSTGHCPHQILQ